MLTGLHGIVIPKATSGDYGSDDLVRLRWLLRLGMQDAITGSVIDITIDVDMDISKKRSILSVRRSICHRSVETLLTVPNLL